MSKNDLNQCQFIGRLGKEVESRHMPNGKAVASFSIAVGSSWKSQAGEAQESTEWINVTAFDKLAEICTQYLTKGSQVFISGRMKTDKYTDKAGVEKYSTKIIADKMQMLGGKPQSASQEPREEKQSAPASGGFDDDIPF